MDLTTTMKQCKGRSPFGFLIKRVRHAAFPDRKKQIKEQLPEAIVIETAPGQHVRIPRTEITTIEPQNTSMMMPGLDKLLTPDELSDIIAYLISLPDGMRIMKVGTK